jgi:micrococcal nuclease
MRDLTVVLLSIVILAGCLGNTPTEVTTGSPPTPKATAPPPSAGQAVTVTEVVDGDTMEIRYRDGQTDTIRLLGVDTPETNGGVSPDEFDGIPDTQEGRAWLGEWAERASSVARSELSGESVRIATDPDADRRGDYGRLLVYLYVDGTTFNERLLDEGYARLYDTRFSKRQQFATAERRAQSAGVGVWGYTTSTASGQDTGGGSSFAVATVHANARGNDHENRNDEYVVFENTGNGALGVGGWTVVDDAGHSYRFPAGTSVVAGETLTLYTGHGADSDGERYWGSDSAIWNNGGDTILVQNASGEVVIEYAYG